MRFREFNILKEAGEPAGYYSVGDSHSNGVSNYGKRPGWKALGKDGSPSTDPKHLAALKTIPKGSVVAISLGANDSGAPEQTVGNVSNIINSALQMGLKVVYLLPTMQADNKPADPKREQLRNALKSAITMAPVIDLGKASSTDPQGVHLDMSAYQSIAGKVQQTAQPEATDQIGKPGAATTKDKAAEQDVAMRAFKTDGSFYVPPLVGNKGPEIADLQKALVALGYSLPKYGVDGIIGNETKQAIKAFQADQQLRTDGIAGKDTLTAVNKSISSNPTVASSLRKSTQADVKSRVQNIAQGDAKGGAGATGSAAAGIKFFINKGWTPEQAAGIVGNLQAESGADLKTDALGDNGQAYGIAQWHPPRQRDFRKAMGKDIVGSSLQDQLAFVDWELNNTESNAGRQLKSAKTAEEAAWTMDEYYERSSGAHRQKRINNAVALLPQTTTTA